MKLPPLLEPSRWARAVREFGILGPLALFMVGGPALGAVVLVATGEQWFAPLEAMPLPVMLACFLMSSVVLAGLSLIPTHAVSLVAGMLLGGVAGSACALLAVSGAAVFCYLVLRRLVGDRARAVFESRPRAAAIHRAVLQRPRRLVGLIALIRLSPVMPFAGTNLALAASSVGLREFLVGSVVGLSPRIIAVAVAGAGLAELDLARAADVRLAIAGGVATVVGLVLIGRIGRAALHDAADVPGLADG